MSEPQNSKKRKTVAPIDFSKPVCVAVYQTPTSNVVRFFQGENAQIHAEAYADEVATKLGKQVAFWGPQRDTALPPEKPSARRMSASAAETKES